MFREANHKTFISHTRLQYNHLSALHKNGSKILNTALLPLNIMCRCITGNIGRMTPFRSSLSEADIKTKNIFYYQCTICKELFSAIHDFTLISEILNLCYQHYQATQNIRICISIHEQFCIQVHHSHKILTFCALTFFPKTTACVLFEEEKKKKKNRAEPWKVTSEH